MIKTWIFSSNKFIKFLQESFYAKFLENYSKLRLEYVMNEWGWEKSLSQDWVLPIYIKKKTKRKPTPPGALTCYPKHNYVLIGPICHMKLSTKHQSTTAKKY